MAEDVHASLVEALAQPSFYPHRPRSVEVRQTPISWVFLAGSFVYSSKKPVRFRFLDYSSREQRLDRVSPRCGSIAGSLPRSISASSPCDATTTASPSARSTTGARPRTVSWRCGGYPKRRCSTDGSRRGRPVPPTSNGWPRSTSRSMPPVRIGARPMEAARSSARRSRRSAECAAVPAMPFRDRDPRTPAVPRGFLDEHEELLRRRVRRRSARVTAICAPSTSA